MDNDGAYKEFHAGQQLKIKMIVSREQLQLLQDWLANIPTLYFLDICAANAIKLSKSALKNSRRKSILVDRLHGLDKPQNCFSFLYILMEKVSDSRNKMSHAQLESQIINDLGALRSFFERATVYESDEFAVDFIKKLKGMPIEIDKPSYLKLLEAANNNFALGNPVPKSLRIDRSREIVGKADLFGISRQHPVVIILLACLYGNVAAKKLVKFKSDKEKFDAENSLSDIMLVSRFSQFKVVIEQYGRDGGRFKRAEFITDDKALGELIEYFIPSSVRVNYTTAGSDTEISCGVDLKRLLTEIKEEEYGQVVALLKP